ncbi:hypothetical protein JYU34_010266 [Plutella xylostella]|uniref:Uncharacterized protein n=1 Tax=Plutella xylostella TaxID=51655 RepID=A0ABQ7QI33_PLUXY|nr:hypothetical protein JYU34_010266 [Plutella xylostella]
MTASAHAELIIVFSDKTLKSYNLYEEPNHTGGAAAARRLSGAAAVFYIQKCIVATWRRAVCSGAAPRAHRIRDEAGRGVSRAVPERRRSCLFAQHREGRMLD